MAGRGRGLALLGEVEVGPPGVAGDGPGLLDLAGERLGGVLVGGDRARGHVVQLDAQGAPAEHLPHRRGVEPQRQRGAGVVVCGRHPRGLVVDDDQLAVAVVEPVDPPADAQVTADERHGALDADRLAGRVDAGEVGGDRGPHLLAPLTRLLAVAEADVDPCPVDQAGPALGGALGEVPPVAQGVVHGVAQRGVRPLAALLGHRAVEVLQAVAARAVEERQQLARARGVEGHRHAGELLLVRLRTHDHDASRCHRRHGARSGHTTAAEQPARNRRTLEAGGAAAVSHDPEPCAK